MAWVQLGSRKLNTALVCYLEQVDEKITLHFQGGGNALELTPEESKGLWRFLKADDLMAVKDKGSAMVLPKRWSSSGPDIAPPGAGGAAASSPAAPAAAQPGAQTPAKPAIPSSTQPAKPHVTVTTSGVSGHKTHSSSHSHSHSHSHSQHKPSHEAPKLAEAKKA